MKLELNESSAWTMVMICLTVFLCTLCGTVPGCDAKTEAARTQRMTTCVEHGGSYVQDNCSGAYK